MLITADVENFPRFQGKNPRLSLINIPIFFISKIFLKWVFRSMNKRLPFLRRMKNEIRP